ncbi:MAG: hypothetical protein H0W88_05585 [Parachlamydiaceae bacterium]|nr:hypothetical protein [Parachlamydiaceae bacterium]
MAAFKKIHMAVIALLMLMTGPVQADCINSSPCESNDCCSAFSCTKGFISVDLLYWRAFQNGLDSCFPIETKDTVSPDGTVISRFKGKGRDLNFKWDPGFRIGTGYEFSNCGWDVAAYWTHFHSRTNKHHNSENSNHWKLNYDTIDLIVGKKFGDSCFTWRPFIGIRAAKIEQKLNGGFANNFDSSGSFSSEFGSESSFSSDFGFTSTRNRQKFTGIGPIFGLEGSWNIGCGFSVYAGAAVGSLYGRYRVHTTSVDVFPFGADFCSISRHLHSCQIFTIGEVGISWLQYYCGTEVTYKLGLECQRYFDHNRLGNYGDLCLCGANFSAGLAF